MNARAEWFDDSSTSGHTIFPFVPSDTKDFGGPVFRYDYESDAPTDATRQRSMPDVNLDVNPVRAARAQLLILLQNRLIIPFSDASTLPYTRPSEPPVPELDWSSCLAGFVDEQIEDGMTALLGEKISNLIRFHGSKVIKRLKEMISSNEVSPSLASHTLRWLGRIKDSASFDSRLELLCQSLRSKSPVIRDSASLGLAALGSTKAIPCLKEAVEQEKLPGLRADLEQVLKELQN